MSNGWPALGMLCLFDCGRCCCAHSVMVAKVQGDSCLSDFFPSLLVRGSRSSFAGCQGRQCARDHVLLLEWPFVVAHILNWPYAVVALILKCSFAMVALIFK